MLKSFKEIWYLVSWLKMNNVQKRMLFWLSSCDLHCSLRTEPPPVRKFRRRGPSPIFPEGKGLCTPAIRIVETKREACYCVLCHLQHVIHVVPNCHAVLRAGDALEQDMKQRKLLFLNDFSRLTVCLSASFQHSGFSYHVNDYNQGQK